LGDRILEVGGAGIEGMDEKVKALMNNMVNAETPGYRKSDVVIKSFPTYLDAAQTKSSTQVPRIDGTYYNHSPGTLLRTGNKTDIAIGGNGFFVVDTPNGEGYTRDGRFTFDKDGTLVTVAGNYPVQGMGGQITVTPGSQVEFSSEGQILVDGMVVNNIKVVQCENPDSLEPISGTTFKAKTETRMIVTEAPKVISGYIEASNVNIIEEMMNMIYMSRIYSVNAKVISTRDAMLSRAMEIGKPAQ
jgi:flagellar basal-body rod protein FlgG